MGTYDVHTSGLAMVHIWKSEDNLWELMLALHHVWLKGQAWVIKLESKYFIDWIEQLKIPPRQGGGEKEGVGEEENGEGEEEKGGWRVEKKEKVNICSLFVHRPYLQLDSEK